MNRRRTRGDTGEEESKERPSCSSSSSSDEDEDEDEDDEDELFANELMTGMIAQQQKKKREEEEEEEKKNLLVLNSFGGRFIPSGIIEVIFKHLSAEDVVNSGKACKIFREVTKRDSIWKRLYFDRWRRIPPESLSPSSSSDGNDREEEGEEEEKKQQQQQQSQRKQKRRSKTFLQKYFERDEKELHSALQNVPESQKQIYADVEASKRSEVPNPANDLLIAASVSTAKNVEGAIRFWKERKEDIM